MRKSTTLETPCLLWKPLLPLLLLLMMMLLLLITHAPLATMADESSHKYTLSEPVSVYASHTGPKDNPQEIYNYYDFPFCAPSTLQHKTPTLGQALQGLSFVKTNFAMSFKQNVKDVRLCSVMMSAEIVKTFQKLAKQSYWYHFYIDDLPMWSAVGDGSENERDSFIYAHKQFMLGFNEDRIVEANVVSTKKIPIREGATISFSYSIEWYPSDTPFEQRFNKYLENEFFEHKIHWFSIFNSFMLVLFLSGLVIIILTRTLKHDLASFRDMEEGYDSDNEFTDESGWKQVHGDVFRAPRYLGLFSTLIGSGFQLVVLVLIVIVFAILGNYYSSRGTLLTAFVIMYAITSVVAGFYSGSHYAKHKGTNWIRTLLMTAAFFPFVCALIGMVMNTLAIIYHSQAAIPFGTMIAMLAIYIFVNVPLVLGGTLLGRNMAGQPDFPCRVNQYPRPIPNKPWYLRRLTVILLGGLLPFGSMFIEMYFVFTSFWSNKFYYVYGFMLLVYIMLIIVTMCVSVVVTYFLLNAEDYRWQYTSFLSAASTALYVFLYALYFFYSRTGMFGLLQFAFYYGYVLMFCFGVALLCGALGYWASDIFTRTIYQNVKLD